MRTSSRLHSLFIPCAFVLSLVLPQVARADVLSVGPGGEHLSLAKAFNALTGRPGDHEIRFRSGHVYGPLFLSHPVLMGNLQVTGGWNETYQRRDEQDGLSTIGLESLTPSLVQVRGSGKVIFDGFRFVGTLDENDPVALSLSASGTSQLIFRRCVFDSLQFQPSASQGEFSLIEALAFESAMIRIEKSRFEDNLVGGTSGFQSTVVQLIKVTAIEQGRGELLGNEFLSNRFDQGILPPGTRTLASGAGAGALVAHSRDLGSLLIQDNQFLGNRLAEATSSQSASAVVLFHGSAADEGLVFERNSVQQGQAIPGGVPGVGVPQVLLRIDGFGGIRLSDSLIALGDFGGLQIQANVEAPVALINLTIADQCGYGLDAEGALADTTLANSVLINNGIDCVGQETNRFGLLRQRDNLVGADPHFRPGTYRLDPRTSPAVDAGTSTADSLSRMDLDGWPRVFNRRVDLGAYESPVIDPRQPNLAIRLAIQSDGIAYSGDPEACLNEALCLSGALEGRAEVLMRLIGPRPNGYRWLQVMRFTPSSLELEVEQLDSGATKRYTLPGLSPADDRLPGFVDRFAFLPPNSLGTARAAARFSPEGLGTNFGTSLANRSPIAASVGPRLDGPFLSSPAFPDFRFRVRITNTDGSVPGIVESECLAERVCVSGALAGRSEAFLRIIGPRPNGLQWVQITRLTPSKVEVDVERIATQEIRSYVLEAQPRNTALLDGRIDREAFPVP